ncbi:hypothetical protein AB0L47_27420 [Streptomyces bobili]|uniref:hypothetical protein n=1 Tax=Streptomyces bobili TaxID=67280 RepID=UPI003412E2FA
MACPAAYRYRLTETTSSDRDDKPGQDRDNKPGPEWDATSALAAGGPAAEGDMQ